MHLNRGLQNLERPGVNAGRPTTGIAVKAAYIAGRLVKAHQPMEARDGLERAIHGSVQLGSAPPRHLDLHEGAEQRSRTTSFIGGGCHRLLVLSSRPR